MKILVTGGAGFIGGNFVHYMVNKYPEDMIVNLDKLTYAGNLETCKPVEDKPNYKFIKGDIADREFIMDLFEKEKFDVVVNFAAESHVDRSIEDPEIFVKTNVMGTTTLLDACVKYGIQRYHQVSTDEVYGDLPLDCHWNTCIKCIFWFPSEFCFQLSRINRITHVMTFTICYIRN